MKKRISSKATKILKISNIIFYFIIYIFLMISILIDVKFYSLSKEHILFITIITFIFGGLIYSFFKVKNIEMDDQYLYINDYFKNDIIPFSNIVSVSENFVSLGRRKLITIDFKNKTLFGTSVEFCAAFFWPHLFKSHPIVEELKSKIIVDAVKAEAMKKTFFYKILTKY